MEKIDNLRKEISRREDELADLRSQLAAAESEVQQTKEFWKWPLSNHEYERYSRQMIVPDFGLQGQLRLRKARVLLVGAGGLGCPAAAYLAGSGIGTIGLVDGDEVEVSNLHRQVAHSTSRVGMSKVQSAITYLQDLNPTITYHAHNTHLTPQNAQDIVSGYDLVLDCTDHPTSRYLISDICVLLSKPLVSASAFQTSGQLIVLNNPPGKGPCYRCVFPTPPPPDSVVGCGEGGIIGPVVGTMGVLQALEAIKLITRGDLEIHGEVKTPMLLLFSGTADTPFRSVRMRGKRKICLACGDENGLTLEELRSSMDYVQFCGIRPPVQLLKPDERVTPKEYEALSNSENKEVLLVDVREKEHFDLCNISGSVNIPISRFMSARGEAMPEGWPSDLSPSTPVYCVCRVGNDSQIAAQKLKDLGLGNNGERFIGDISGGIKSWKSTVDPTVPFI
ncbi:molybdenum cofactor biosynthetic enzyme [Fusarium heterosporum]|uniref:Adenylyltransferase and sulfurtransferase uba4 n=1 Tax=Fusarium heterosporum TaxID=42747 RepID=A0A8H5TVW0_FUSHE|nr:molybdenum cofactor biosynthetic enzyme [Fusarium heterosporum]